MKLVIPPRDITANKNRIPKLIHFKQYTVFLNFELIKNPNNLYKP
jgi:hypothetical protein